MINEEYLIFFFCYEDIEFRYWFVDFKCIFIKVNFNGSEILFVKVRLWVCSVSDVVFWINSWEVNYSEIFIRMR